MAPDGPRGYLRGMRDRHERAADKVRAEAYRLGLEGQCADAAEIEARMIAADVDGVSAALEPIRRTLDGLCRAAKKPRGVGVEALFRDA